MRLPAITDALKAEKPKLEAELVKGDHGQPEPIYRRIEQLTKDLFAEFEQLRPAGIPHTRARQ